MTCDSKLERVPKEVLERLPRAFRPLTIYLIISIPILAWDVHRRAAANTFLRVKTTVDGQPSESPLQLEIDGRPVALAQPIPIGTRQIKLSARDTEPWATQRFVWYGDNALGKIDLKRSRGALEVAAKPTALEVVVQGRYANVTNQPSEVQFKALPVGDYRLQFRFQHFNWETNAHVARNTTTRIAPVFPVGSLHVEAEPSGARYELQGMNLRSSRGQSRTI